MSQKIRRLTPWHRPYVSAVASYGSTRVLLDGNAHTQAGSAPSKIRVFHNNVPSISGEKRVREFASYQSKDEEAVELSEQSVSAKLSILNCLIRRSQIIV